MANQTSKQKNLDVAIGDRLAEMADGSNFGTLEALQEQLLAWSMDLRSGAQSILDYSPDETKAKPAADMSRLEYRRSLGLPDDGFSEKTKPPLDPVSHTGLVTITAGEYERLTRIERAAVAVREPDGRHFLSERLAKLFEAVA